MYALAGESTPIFKLQLPRNPVPEPSRDPCLPLSESLQQYLGEDNGRVGRYRGVPSGPLRTDSSEEVTLF